MKNLKFKALAGIAAAAICSVSAMAGGCTAAQDTTGKSSQLGSPANATPLSYAERTEDGFVNFMGGVEDFAAKFAYEAYAAYEGRDNFAVSPISVYMALSLAAECSGGQTREELLDALGVSYGDLTRNFPLLYRLLYEQSTDDAGKVINALIPTNSIWVNEGTPVNAPCIDSLSDDYFCYSYSADFRNDNQSANKAVREFIKEQTRGLIDKDFQLSDRTLFALINTLYLKTVWNNYGEDLELTGKKYGFTNSDGSKTDANLLQGYYFSGKVCETTEYKTFYTATQGGYRIKFILPNDGYTVDDVFTEENIAAANSAKYVYADDENKIIYNTRCLFPEYKCSYDGDICAVLSEKFGVNLLFDRELCDFSTLTEMTGYCSAIRHVTDLTVDRKGIEGAAVTVLVGEGTAAPGDEYTYVYEDFVIDRAFGFIISDASGVTLFSGVVNSI